MFPPEGAIPVCDLRQVVVRNSFPAPEGSCHLAPADRDGLDLLDLSGDLLSFGRTLVERVATAVEADLLGDGHENRIVHCAGHGLTTHHLVRLLLQKQQAGEDVDVRFHDERLHRKVHAGEYPGAAQSPPANVFRGRISEDAVGQDDTHASAGPEPVEAALDEQDLGRDAALQPPGVAKAAVFGPLPDMSKLERLEDVHVGDRYGRTERWIGRHHVDRPKPSRVACGTDTVQVACRKLQRVEMVQVALAVTRHHHVHLARSDEKRIEVAPEDLLRGVAPQPLVQRFELLRGLGRGIDSFLLPEPLHPVRERRHQKAAGTARRIEQPFFLLRVEHLDHEANRAPRREVLPPVAAQVGADDLLIGSALGVHVDARELVLRQLRDHERERAVRETDLFATAEDRLVLLLHLAEERIDAIPDCFAAGIAELFFRTRPEAAPVPARSLVVHLAEDEVEKLPERASFGMPSLP